MSPATGDNGASFHRSEFAKRLTALYVAAGSPSLRMLATWACHRADEATHSGRVFSVSAQRISDWKSGKNVPANFEVLQPVLTVLFDRVRRRKVPVDHRLVDIRSWREFWTHVNRQLTRARVEGNIHSLPASTKSGEERRASAAVPRGRGSRSLALVDGAANADLVSLLVCGQTAVDAAMWAAAGRDPAMLYDGSKLATALNYLDIALHPAPMMTHALVVDFLRTSSMSIDIDGRGHNDRASRSS
ncbi:hypothetical protein [Nocardia niwae]